MLVVKIIALAAVVGFAGLVCLQILLALGLPIGQTAWGGKYTTLPPRLRIASLFSAGVLGFASIIVLEKAGMLAVFNTPLVAKYGIWVFAVFLLLNTAGNLASRSKLEKRFMTPVSSVLSVACFSLAIIT